MPLTRTIRNHAPAALLAAAVTAASLAALTLPHAKAATPTATHAAATVPHHGVLEHVNKRLATLKHQLEITHDEEPAWHAFAQMSRANATGMEGLYRDRAKHLATMNAVQNMESYAAIQAKQADDMNKLSAAFHTLYGKLAPAQQHKVDAMFRVEAERHLHHHRATKHG